jgi:hypothetical protein
MFDGIAFHDQEEETFLEIKVPIVKRASADAVAEILEFRIYPTQEPEIQFRPYNAVIMNPELVEFFQQNPKLQFRFHFTPKLHRSHGIPIDLPICSSRFQSHLPVVVDGVHEWVEEIFQLWYDRGDLDTAQPG